GRAGAAVRQSVKTGRRGAMNPDITIFVSCYNERDSIIPTIETLLRALARVRIDWELLLIDDCSQDESAAVVEQFIRTHPDLPIRLLRHAANQGLGRTIFEAARLARGKYFWCVAGDNPVPEATCATLFAQLGRADIIIPYVTRYQGRTLFRRVLSDSYGMLVRLASGAKVKYFNGSSIYLREQFLKHSDIPHGFAYSAEMIITLINEGSTYVEVPVLYNDRSSGASTAVSLRNFFDVAGLFARLIARRLGWAARVPEHELLSDRG